MVDIADLQERATGVHVSKTSPCGDDHIVLLDYDQASRSKLRANLRRVKSDGAVVWAASAPRFQRHFHQRGLARRPSGRVDLGMLQDYGGPGDRKARRRALHEVGRFPEHWPLINAYAETGQTGVSEIAPSWSPAFTKLLPPSACGE
jgi:hypothetical protein